MTRDDMKAIVERMYAAANAGDLDAVEEIFAPDFYSHPMGTTGPEAVKSAWRDIRERYPDLRVTLEDMLIDGDKIALRSTVHGAVGADGRPDPALMEMIRLADGRVAEVWGLTGMVWR
ncbi:nuclear transport factor 2 family protein [Sphaerisporangium sp. NPDC005288]|uniref:ester cyclase n=1 Tax=Sphaerisporangium sp. NPDC005288 TaxID=3155114 RepID=UPI0033AFD9ED